jgi:hypothetical protein
MTTEKMKRTIPDWLSHASAATDPGEMDRCVVAATAQAASSYDWRTLLRGLADLGGAARSRLAEAADRTLEHAERERDVWCFRDVATVRKTHLDDELGARAALETCARVFEEPATDALGPAAELLGQQEFARGYEWVLLGEGFLQTLNDMAGMSRCLERGRDRARAQGNADDMCSIATAWAKHVDRDAGAALLADAEAMAKNETANPWTLANAWRSLDDQEGVRRVLDRALQKANSFDDALHVAHAWASHGAVDETRAALARAEELATTASDWLEIAESAFDAHLEDGSLRRAVERADALADDDESRSRVSSAYHHWLHDDEAAARIGPRGLRPEALRPRVRELAGWETSASGLFDWLRARATLDVLTHIATADYATSVEKHLAALVDICGTGLIPKHLEWEPHEVLALTRWSVGEEVDHVERALSCTLLCLAPRDLDELVTNGPILAESCLALGNEPSHLAERFFAWRSETEDSAPEPGEDDDDGPEQAFALLLLFLLRSATMPTDPRLSPLADMIVEHATYKPETLAEWIRDSMKAELWDDLFDRILEPLRGPHPHVARLLRALGRS